MLLNGFINGFYNPNNIFIYIVNLTTDGSADGRRCRSGGSFSGSDVRR